MVGTGFIVDMAVSFALRQVQKFADKTDWSKVKADLAVRVRDLVPGEFFDTEAAAASNAAIELVEKFLKGDTDEKVVKLIVAGKLKEAGAELVTFVRNELGL